MKKKTKAQDKAEWKSFYSAMDERIKEAFETDPVKFLALSLMKEKLQRDNPQK